jgi:hypothetical protein
MLASTQIPVMGTPVCGDVEFGIGVVVAGAGETGADTRANCGSLVTVTVTDPALTVALL